MYNNNYLPFDFEDKSYIVWCDYVSSTINNNNNNNNDNNNNNNG